MPPGLHVWFATHAPHWPPWQTCPLPHDAPSAATPVWVQLAFPELQSVMPTRQALPIGAHGAFVVHAVHAPPLQTRSVPQGVPSLTLVAPVHVCWPVEHDVVPLWHGAPVGVHATPAVQDTHAPPLHTLLTPQEVPSVALPFVSVQASPPSAQDAVPVWQGAPAGTQEAPCVHAWHAPSSQKRLAPHGIPLGAWPPGVHTGVPEAHAMDAAWQEPASPIWQAAGAQIFPGEQPVVWSAAAASLGPGPPSVVASTPASRSASVPVWMPKRASHADTATVRTTRSAAMVRDRASMQRQPARGRQGAELWHEGARRATPVKRDHAARRGRPRRNADRLARKALLIGPG